MTDARREALRVINGNIDAAHTRTRESLNLAERLLVEHRKRLHELDPRLPPDPYDGPAWWKHEAEWLTEL